MLHQVIAIIVMLVVFLSNFAASVWLGKKSAEEGHDGLMALAFLFALFALFAMAFVFATIKLVFSL